MAHLNHNRSKLLLGCGSAALAMGMAMAPDRASAQAFQATENVIVGSAERAATGSGTETIAVNSPTAVIEWVPDEDGAGNALDFLPTFNQAIFQNGANNPDFAVLNVILPAANGNVTVFDGAVISQLIDGGTGAVTPGGTVAFYSPSGILVGPNAIFDVGNLILTTLEPDLASFDDFATIGGQLNLGSGPTTASIIISPGAQITASAENSYFAVTAAEIQMFGTADINGSHAYVAGEAVNLTVSNGLFDIQIPVGTTVGTPIQIDGDVGGPSSTGIAGDNHLIYAVAAAQTDPISLIFSGNLGFDVAASAGIVNGEIILSANYDVNGRVVDGGSVADGLNAIFDADSALTDVAGNIFLRDFDSLSTILAIANERVQVSALTGPSFVDGNLIMVGRNFSELSANNGQQFDITGDVYVSADGYGRIDFSTITGETDAVGGRAFIDAFGGGVLNIGGDVVVSASAVAGVDLGTLQSGNATGGNAAIASNGGELNITGFAEVISSAIRAQIAEDFLIGADFNAGVSQLFATQGGQVTIDGDVFLTSDALGTTGDLVNPSTASNAFSGVIGIQAIDDDSALILNGNVTALAIATAGVSNESAPGGLADGGDIFINIDSLGLVDIAGNLFMAADAVGGDNAGGQGGDALGGASRILVPNGGTVLVGGNFNANGRADGGAGNIGGGNAFGGLAGAQVVIGGIDIQGTAFASTVATGGDANFLGGFGGDGGNAAGGNSFLQADGTQTETAILTVGAGVTLLANGAGGIGGQGDGSVIGAGQGGEGSGGNFGTPNQADTNFNSGAFLLAGGDNGNISVGGSSLLNAVGSGGAGGIGGVGQAGGNGGEGNGGSAAAGLLLIGTDGSVGAGTATFTGLTLISDGFGGDGGNGGATGDPQGFGGPGNGSRAQLFGDAGTVVADSVFTAANGIGGAGVEGGFGFGGDRVGSFTQFGGSITVDSLSAFALGVGGAGFGGVGGDGFGGIAFIDLQDGSTQVNGDVTVNATGTGGESDAGDGSNGSGGSARISIDGPIIGNGTVTGHASVLANGIGGAAGDTFTGGTGTGGDAFVQAQAGGAVTLGSTQIVASGLGGSGITANGGDGIGGIADIASFDAGSQVIIQNSTPLGLPTNGPLTQSNSLLVASGVGGQTTGGSGVGGTGTGGTATVSASSDGAIALPADPMNDVNGGLFNRITARGVGGNSEVENGTGGLGVGGIGSFEALGGTITTGQTIFTTFGQGGTGAAGVIDINGGDGVGGERRILIDGNGVITAEFAGGTSAGLGGFASGTGANGDASGGLGQYDITNGTLNLVGESIFFNGNQGGSGGQTGGDASAGVVNFNVTNSTINVTANGNANGNLVNIGGQARGGVGVSQGGSAVGDDVTVSFTDSIFNGGRLQVLAGATGGAASDINGVGGDATAGTVDFNASNTDLNLTGQNAISASALGGNAANSGIIVGNATGGTVTVDLIRGSLIITPDGPTPGILQLTTGAFASGETSGDALTGPAQFFSEGTIIDLDEMIVTTFVQSSETIAGGTAGTATAGIAEVQFNGNSDVTIADLSIFSDAISGLDGAAFGGAANLVIGNSAVVGAPDVEIVNLDLTANASGGTNGSSPANTAGTFSILAQQGVVTIDNIRATALGDLAPSAAGDPSFRAVGGDILVVDTVTVDVLDNFNIETGLGSILGGPTLLDPSADIEITSQGSIIINGDDDNFIGFGGQFVTLTSRDIIIENGARIGAAEIDFVSLNTDDPAILGGLGTPSGIVAREGYTLIADELGRLEVETVNFTFPFLDAGANNPDLILRDVAFSGSLNNGISNIFIDVGDIDGGIARIEGLVELADAAASDTFNLTTTDRIEVVTPGGIRISDPSGNPTGTLFLGSGNIWVADSNLIALLQADPNFAGRDDQLAVSAAGSEDPLGFLRADSISLEVGQSLLVRNSGVSGEQAGVLVGDGGLSIFSPTPANTLDVFAYGARIDAAGNLIAGETFFQEINFNNATTNYTAEAEFNDCVITTADCGTSGGATGGGTGGTGGGGVVTGGGTTGGAGTGTGGNTPPVTPAQEQAAAVVNNPAVVDAAITTIQPVTTTEQESNDDFGMDFPGLVEEPEVEEDGDIDDPVASGGDSSLYGLANTGNVEVEGN